MISKENFIKYINKIQSLKKIEESINSAGKELEFSISFSEHESLVLNILQEVFKDKENDWIGYFIYDLEFGKKWHKGSITVNGKDVPMRNAEELYKILKDNLYEN